MLKYQITTAPAVEPVTLEDMKTHLRVSCDADDGLIASLIEASREWCEIYENRAYITQTITLNTFYLADQIILPKPLLQSVTSVTYVDIAGDTQTLSSDLYDVDTVREPGQITRAYSESYPAVRGDVNGVTVVYKAGYGDTAADVPERVKAAIKLMCGHLYEHRETVSDMNLNDIPLGVKSLLYERMKTV